jgi:hypothetical protein
MYIDRCSSTGTDLNVYIKLDILTLVLTPFHLTPFYHSENVNLTPSFYATPPIKPIFRAGFQVDVQGYGHKLPTLLGMCVYTITGVFYYADTYIYC